MRTKLFLAFLSVLATALVSNLIFERLIIRDFGEYAMGAREDQIYWVLASVEGSYVTGSGGGWDKASLESAVHWAVMLGYEAEVRDALGNSVIGSARVVEHLSPTMKRRMEAMVRLDEPEGEFEEYPLFVEGEGIGSLRVRPIKRLGLLSEREAMFRGRGRDFLLISFLIAGGGALFLSFVFSQFLSRPVRRLKSAAQKVAEGDFSVRVDAGSKDEIGRLAGSFNHMVEALEREDALRKHLTSNIAHELRTPLAVIKANLEAMEDGVIETGAGGLSGLRSEVERLIRLVEGIEDVTKAEASFFKGAGLEKLELKGFLEGLAQTMRPLFISKGLYIGVEDKGELQVSTDIEKLETVIRNMLSNSLRHTEKGGVSIDYGSHKGGFFIEVRDTGEGIPEEDLPKVFDRFYSKGGGAGLGLAISKELIETMGGKIEAKSGVGEGSTFRVALPARGK